ncbi:exocyst complex component 4 [Holotrichia oblita]|uniref:Exocyst complex component 4 n=1 Tax=Holotrichia oblita TaxID=644536 RepID=A0ACB9SRS3_HOLOL|nr:exocyst complex component 4 [Holotrichia oblita]
MDSPPTKPPRGVKTTKETSGLLMSVIRTLSATETNEQRDREKAKLDNEFKLCDRRLDDLVQKHEGDLTQVMTIFSTLSQQVTESREKIQKIKKNLQACKTLLHCKRDDLKKLWIEGLEYKYMLQLLEEIEKMHEIPIKVQTHLSKKEYLHATKLLVEAANLGKDNLEGIEGIKELKTDIEQKKEELHLILLNELKQQIYIKTSQHVLSLSRQSSQKEGGLNSQFRRSNEFRMSSRRNISRRIFQDTPVKFQGKFDEFDIEEDLFVLSQENDPSHFVAILVKCLALLDRVPYAVDILKSDMKSELLNIAQRTTIFINDFKNYRDDGEQNKLSLLVEFMQTLFEQFRQVAHAHSLLLRCFQRAITAHKIDVKLYDMHMYWTQVQFVIQNLLHDYLDIQNSTVDVQPNDHFTDDLENLSSYFSRRKQQPKKTSLFKFDDSSSALTMNSNLKETKQDKILVCTPDINNILHIFIPLMCFVEDIEESMGLPHGSKCTLHQFLSGYVTNTFLKRKHTETKAAIEEVTHTKDAWKATVLLDVTVDYKPLLVSVVTVEKTVTQWQAILQALPMYGEHIVKYACDALKEFRDTCHAAYRGIVQPHTEDRRICSAAWLKDDDISRFLKCSI